LASFVDGCSQTAEGGQESSAQAHGKIWPRTPPGDKY
jgi:hypothetical protein